MAYISTESVADIRARLKAKFPAKDGWKLSVTNRDHTEVHVSFMAGPHTFKAWNFDKYSFDPTVAKCRAEAENTGAVKTIFAGSVNHYHIKEHWTGESAKILQDAYDIIRRDHWDKSNIQTDYFNCAFYISMAIGKWDKDYKLTR